jgi:hypothetical protein
MTFLMQNEARRGAESPQHPRHQDMNTSYSDFLVTHPPLFSGAKDPLEVDDWLHAMDWKTGRKQADFHENRRNWTGFFDFR